MAMAVTADTALGALIEKLVSPTLAKLKPFAGARAAEQDIANQMQAVAWLYNQYICQEIPNLVALDWEDLCNKASVQQTRLSKFMGTGRPAVLRSLTPTEHKVKNACEAAKALRAPNGSRESIFVTKVCVCLMNFRQDKCVLALGATTVGVWSFIEKEKHALCSESGSGEGPQFMLSDDEFAFKAVQEQTGIKADVLGIEDCFLINDDLNRAGGSTKFFIMSCMGTFDLSPIIKLEKIAWISLDVVCPKARDFLIDTSGSSVHSTPAVQYFHLRPFCSSLESWLSRREEVKSLVQPKHAAEEDRKDLNSTDLIMASTGGSNKEKSGLVQEQVGNNQRPSKLRFDSLGLNMQLFAPTRSPQSSAGMQNSQKHAVEKVQDSLALNRQLFAPTGRPQSSAGMQNNQKHAVGKVQDSLALNMQLFAPTGSPQSSTGMQKNNQKHAVEKVQDSLVSNMQLIAPTGSPKSSTGMQKNQKHAAEKVQDCSRTELLLTNVGVISGEKSPFVHAQVDDKRSQSKLDGNVVGLNTQSALAMKNRTEVSALREGGTTNDISASVNEHEGGKAKQGDQKIHAVALDTNLTAPNFSPQSSTKIKKKEEEHILDKAGALLSLKTAYRCVRKKRKDLCKDLREHTLQTDLLYKQIEECDSNLATLMGGGKSGLQLAIQLCKTDGGQKQTSSSDVSIDQSQPEALLKSSRTNNTSQAETNNKKRPFRMLKSSMQELNEVCTRNQWPLPSYGVFSSKNKQRQIVYSGKVKIRGNDFELSETGEATDTAKAAKLSAAAYMLSTLHLLRARNATL